MSKKEPVQRFKRLGPIELVPRGEGRSFRVAGIELAMFHTRAGEVFVTDAACPHKGGPLADGLVGGTTVVCPLHARRFDLATGNRLDGGDERDGLCTYPILVKDGEVFVDVSCARACA